MRVGRSAGAIAMAAISIGLSAAPASASEGISSFAVAPSTTQAGANPNVTASFQMEMPGSPDEARSATLDLPVGLVAIPSSVGLCAAATFAMDECPVSSQVGLAVIHAAYEGEADHLLGTAPIFALEPAAGGYGALGFIAPETEAHITAALSIRSASDYGLRADLGGLDQGAPLAGLALELWGVPAEASHDDSRFPRGAAGEPPGCPGVAGASCLSGTLPSPLPQTPFTLAPTNCEAKSLSAALSVTSVEDPSHPSQAEAAVPGTTGCDQLAFNPSLFAEATTSEGDSPSGLDIEVRDPVNLSPSVPTASELRVVGLALPYEMELNAAGLEAHAACTDAEAGLGTEAPADCPDGSLLGSFSMKLPGGTASGHAYLGKSETGGPLRLLLIASGAGFEVKLLAELELEPESESFVIWLEDLPQLPIGEYGIHLFGGPEAPFVTPLYCEENEFESFFVPWDEALSNELAHFAMTLTSGPGGAPCLGPATQVQVSLSRSAVPADGSSTTTATATVTDANAERVPYDQVSFSSSDPGQKIGPVHVEGDGTYVATITASTTPGTSTITATDGSVEPALSGSAALTEAAPGCPGPIAVSTSGCGGSAAGNPVARIVGRPSHRTRDRRPRFRFTGSPSAVGFECRIDRHAFEPCRSPFTPGKLAPGRHRFDLRADGPAGAKGPISRYSFRVLRARRR